MSSYSELLTIQSTLFDLVKKINVNFSKDGPGRKTTIEYHERKLENLERAWNEFQLNDAQISSFEGEKTGPYFEKNIFEIVSALYTETKTMILKSKAKIEVMDDEEHPGSKVDFTSAGTSKVSTPTPSGSCSKTQQEQYDQQTQEMLNEQQSNIKAFERAIRNLEINNTHEKWQLEDKLRTLTQRWEKIDNTYWKIDNIVKNTKAFEIDYNRLERLFEYNKAQINRKIWDNNHQQKCIPKIELPNFNGNYAQWTTFKDLFIEIVHQNSHISNAQKMQHLKSKLKGEAEKLVQHLSISADNYEACWEILQHRYDNIRLLFTYHANTLLNQPVIHNATSTQLKRMHDVTIECLHAIKNLNIDTESWDPLIIHILQQKLDSDTIQSFSENMQDPKEIPKLQEFLKFIETKFMSLESSANTVIGNRGRNNFENQQQNKALKTSNNMASSNKYKPPQQKTSYFEHQNSRTFQGSKSFYNTIIKCPKCNKPHGLYSCRYFLTMSPEERLKTVNSLQVCNNCLFSHNGQKCTSINKCRVCEQPHSSLLHESYENCQQKPTTSGQRLSTHMAHDNEVLLATALIKVLTNDGSLIILRALLDQGSQVSLITEDAAQQLQIKRNKLSAVVSGIGAIPSTKCKGLIQLNCQSLHNDFTFKVEALVMTSLTSKLPNKTVDKTSFEHLEQIQLADPQFNISQDIDLLLGADIYSEILMEGLIKTDSSSLIAQQTKLGWIVCGKYKTFNCNVIINNLRDIAKFWEQESVQDNEENTSPDDTCEKLYIQSTTRLADGRYEVRLPLKPNFEQNLGNSKSQAIAQFQQLERKMVKNPTYAQDYREFIHEYISMGHMKQSQQTSDKTEYFLPHHGVLRPGAVTTKLRVVFNASAKTTSKYSLNDLMETGPNLQKDILGILTQWRLHKYVLTADIEKMYRFISVHPEHRSLQKIVWRDSPNQLLREYQLSTVTYGTKAAPYLALRTLQQLASDEGDRFPKAKGILQNQFFVDDALFGTDSVDEAIQTRNQLIQLLKCGGFNLRKWSSNNSQLVEDLPEDMRNPLNFMFTETQTSKALGLAWNPKHDEFIFSSTLKQNNNSKKVTKREILSEISTIFDPLGFLSPITIKSKILFQQVWKYNIGWDEEIPEDLKKEWSTLRNELVNMKPFKIQRWLGCETNIEYELHAFCDASEKAYSCVIYSLIRNNTTNTQISLVAAKTKVAPISKQQTLPRLELCGAQLLAQLVQKIKQYLNRPNIKTFAWTDSMVVLGWLNGDITRWKSFVARRVKEIVTIIPANDWKHVRSEQNPADCASRGLLPSQLKNFTLWFDGPEWLRSGKISEENKPLTPSTNMEVKVHTVTSTKLNSTEQNIIITLINKNSCLITSIRTLAWVLRFINNTRARRHRGDSNMNHTNTSQTESRNGYLTLSEMRDSMDLFIKQTQQQEFGKEILELKTKNKININSKILKLSPYLDKKDVLRVGGRLQNSNLSENQKHPIIIPKDGRLTSLLIQGAHMTTLHGGARLTLATLRQQYWVIGGNSTVKKHLQQCVRCCRFKQTNKHQIMADLPSVRTTISPPFFHTGVDYTGYVDVKLNKGRGVKTSKGYIVVFICMSTKAIHLELATDLSTTTFLLALERMIARRGCPKHIYSDNGTNFVGADKEIRKHLREYNTFNNESFIKRLNDLGTEWHFNAPSWPTAGGLWEAAVKSMKHHLRRVLGEQKLTYEEFLTLLTQIEACLNSRPLGPLTEDIEDLDYLTPGHFLIGRPLVTLPHQNLEEEHISLRDRWQHVEKMKQGFWKKWSSEYLQLLQTRSKWTNITENIKIGDIMLIKEENLPPLYWSLGRVQETHPGKDSLVRVVTLKTKSGTLKRPITKLVKLPINNTFEKPDTTDPNITQPSEQKQKHKRNTNSKATNISTKLLCTLLTLMTFFNPSKSSDIVNTTQFEQNRSIYFDKIGNLQCVHDYWKIVTYYNMSSYWQGINNVEKLVSHLHSSCNKFDYKTVCETMITEFDQEFSELEHNNYLLETHHGQITGREKRGLVNGVGYMANSLFGVLDERFAKQYEKDIDALKQNRDHLLTLIKRQTTIIEAHNNILKRNEKAMNKQFKLISDHLNTTDSYIQSLNMRLEREENVDYFNTMALITTIILSKLRHIQHMLLDTATNIHHGHVDTRLLPQNQLLHELNIISGQLPKHLSIPVDDLQVQLADVYKILEVKSRMTERYFIIEITLPLTSDNQLTIYKPISVPMLLLNNNLLTMKTSSDYIAVNIRKETYMQLSEKDLEHCIKVEPITYVCSINKPTNNMRSLSVPCEVGVITNVTSSNCTYLTNTCKNYWIPLLATNTWMYVCCGDCAIQIICGERMTAVHIHHTGIIRVIKGCVIKTGEQTFYTEVYYQNNMYINPEIPTIDMTDINNLTSIHPIHPETIQFSSHTGENNYNDLEAKIEAIKTKTSEEELTTHDMHQYAVSYSTLIFVVIASLVGSWYCIHRRRRSKAAAARVTARATRASAAPPAKPPRLTPQPTTSNRHIYATPHTFEIAE